MEDAIPPTAKAVGLLARLFMNFIDLLFLLIFISAMVFFGIGLGVGLLHNRKPNKAQLLQKHNLSIINMTTWLRGEKRRIAQEMQARNMDTINAVDKVASELENRYLVKDANSNTLK